MDFKPEVRYNSLSPRDKRTVSYVFHNIHALPFEARSQENAAEGYLVEFVVKTLHEKVSSLDKDVAYKGGTIEKQLLSRLNIPHVDLEAYDCPKANCLLWNGFEPLFDCGHHTFSFPLPSSGNVFVLPMDDLSFLIGNGRNEHVPELVWH